MTTSQPPKKAGQPPTPIPPSDFGKDHWSALAYIETRVVDYSRFVEGIGQVGTLDTRHLRTNPERHPWGINVGRWKDEYSTRLSGYWITMKNGRGRRDPHRQVIGHDDWDCIDDLEAAGMIEVWSTANAFVTLTPYGVEIAGALRAHKAAGGQFAEFRLSVAA